MLRIACVFAVAVFFFGLLGDGLASADDTLPLDSRLAAALRQADVTTSQRLLAADPEQVDARDARGWTPLMHAAFYADADCVKLCLAEGANVRATNDAGATALHYAAADASKLKLLIEAGADVNAATKLGNTALMLAVRNSHSAPTGLLLGNRADVHLRNIFGVTALMIASSTDDMETVGLLLDRGADPSLVPYYRPLDATGAAADPIFGGGFNALTWASLQGHLEIAKALVAAGADVNGQSMFGAPLVAATQRDRRQLAEFLLDRGADVNAVAPAGTWTPLMWAAANELADPQLVELLLQRGANVNALEGAAWGPQMSVPHSPLMIAQRRGETLIVKALRKAGAQQHEDPWALKVHNPNELNLPTETIGASRLLNSLAIALPLLERTAVDSVQEFASHGQNCISCHNQLLPLIAVSLAKQKGIPHDEHALAELVTLVGSLSEVQHAIKSEPTFEPSPSSFFGYQLWGLAAESIEANTVTDMAVHSVAVHQSRDGHWLQPFPRPPLTDSEISATALGIRALTLYPLPGRQSEMSRRIARAQQWLRDAKPRVTEDYVYKLLGLHWAGSPLDELVSPSQSLAGLQRADGGWAQLPGLQSDAYATGQALYALQAAAERTPRDPVIKRGLAYLVQTQGVDGSWFVRRRAYPFQPTMDPVFPHGRDGWISAAATSWAVMAICVGLDMRDVEQALLSEGFRRPAKAEPDFSRLPQAVARPVHFERDILPLLESSCLDCHNASDQAGKYSLETRDRLIQGGFSGRPVVVPGDSANSALIGHVAGLIEDVEMPPMARRKEYEPLTEEQIAVLRAWIDQGLPGMR